MPILFRRRGYVFVQDYELPELISPVLQLDLIAGSATITEEIAKTLVTDNCGILSTTISKQSFTCNDHSPQLIEITFVDFGSNEITFPIEVVINGVQTPIVEDMEACNSFVWPVNGAQYEESGTYQAVFENQFGCDSIHILNLVINQLNPVITEANQTLSISGVYDQIQWLDCDNDFAQIPGETDNDFEPEASGNYAVRVVQANCIDTSECHAFQSVGIFDWESNNSTFDLYPNPTTGQVTLDLGFAPKQKITATVFSISGSQIHNKVVLNAEKTQIDLRSLKPGAYIIQLATADERITKRLIKK